MSVCVQQLDRFSSTELRDGLGLEDDTVCLLRQNRSSWYGHVLRKNEDDWVRCLDYDADGVRPRGRPTKAWKLLVMIYSVCIYVHPMH